MSNPLLSARQATVLGKVNAELRGEGIEPARAVELDPLTGTVLVESCDYRATITTYGVVRVVGT